MYVAQKPKSSKTRNGTPQTSKLELEGTLNLR